MIFPLLCVGLALINALDGQGHILFSLKLCVVSVFNLIITC